MTSFLKHVKVTYDNATYGDTSSHIGRTLQDVLAIDPSTKTAGDGVIAGNITKNDTDGVISGSPTSTFTNSGISFVSGDVGKYLQITSGVNTGWYAITTYNGAHSIAVGTTFIGNDSSISFNVVTPTTTFTSASVTFTSGDVGKYLYITSGLNLGLYLITTFNSATSIVVNRNFIANGTAITFDVSSNGSLYPNYYFCTYNGQEIPNRLSEATGSFAKFWYEVSTGSGTVTFNFYANSAYLDPNFSGNTPASPYAFATTDVITISYLVEV